MHLFGPKAFKNFEKHLDKKSHIRISVPYFSVILQSCAVSRLRLVTIQLQLDIGMATPPSKAVYASKTLLLKP